MKRLLLILAFTQAVFGTDYYVRKDGNDGNAGTADNAAGAWLTVDKAASTAAAGDTVYVRQGWYNESSVVFDNSGTAGNPIVFEGEGNWLTIIDGSTSLSNNWAEDLSVGVGVYTNLTIPWEISEMQIGGKRVAFAYTNGEMQTMIDTAYASSGLTTGLQLLNIATDQVYTYPLNGTSGEMWDGIEAMFCSTPTKAWLRLRDRSDPNGLPIRIARNASGTESTDINYPMLNINTKSYITIRNFKLRGSIAPLFMFVANNCIVESNHITGGYSRMWIDGLTNSIIRYNWITTDWYGGVGGAWGSCGTDVCDTNVNQYVVGKYIMGAGEQFDYGTKFRESGTNYLYGNTFGPSLCEGIAIGVDSVQNYITNNFFTNCSAHSIMLWEGQQNTQIYDNTFRDGNIHLRYHDINTASEQPRSVYAFRNTFYNPDGAGDHIYVHALAAGGTTTNKALWFYQNSVSGGHGGWMVSGNLPGIGGLVDFNFLNNVWSVSNLWIVANNSGANFWTNAYMMGEFDYNYVPPLSGVVAPYTSDAAWFGANNVQATTNQWANTLGMSFVLPANSQAINAGMDIPATYPALPQDSTVKVGAQWDIGALEYSPPVSNRRITVTTLRVDAP